jgi:uncharacterized 2Fe-2S/4Fe-4S cluster protein (DUF4445 family)
MPRVHFSNEGASVDVALGMTILEAARLAGVKVESPCNGSGTCGKCRIRIGGREVLACETPVADGAEVTTLGLALDASGAIASGELRSLPVAPFVTKSFSHEENATSVLGGGKPMGTECGDTRDRRLGLVVDIGTTTLVVALVDLESGAELASRSALNPQAIHAQDVLSRIRIASEPAGLALMQSELIAELNGMIRSMAGETGLDQELIYEAVFSGNTCMLHLAAGADPSSLGRFPYEFSLRGDSHLAARDIGLDISPFGLVYLPPLVSAYVGADITSGILATRLGEEKGTVLFIDIGTNGEMVISRDGDLAACSTAAGPAFEGMNISCGMRAAPGAIEHFEISSGGEVLISTIADAESVGICGSGLMDIVGELASAGAIDARGRIRSPGDCSLTGPLAELFAIKDGKPAYFLSDRIYLSQKDVRQVQLAKGAVRAGIEFLLRNRGITASDVDRVLIAGSFGYHLRPRSLIELGLVPPEFEGRLRFVGNTSKSGGQSLLLNEACRLELAEKSKRVEVVELSAYGDFDEVFMKSLGFDAEAATKN